MAVVLYNMKNFLIFAFELIKIVVISLIIIIPIRYFLIQPFYVKGASMEPTFQDSQYLIVDEITYRFEQPHRGDVVVFHYPLDTQEYFIKRVIGLPGEKVQIKDGSVYIFKKGDTAGQKLNEPYLAADVKTYSQNEDPITLGPNEYFFMGDNRTASKDSRSFGPVNRSFIVGRVMFRGWPLDKITLFGTPAYQ